MGVMACFGFCQTAYQVIALVLSKFGQGEVVGEHCDGAVCGVDSFYVNNVPLALLVVLGLGNENLETVWFYLEVLLLDREQLTDPHEARKS